MTLGDFFKTATHCAPVNPKPIEITLIAKGPTLPGGEKNPPGRIVRAKAKGAFIFLNAEETAAARDAARRCAADRATRLAGKDAPLLVDENDVAIDEVYEILQRCIREYDEKDRTAGDPLFPSSSIARELLVNSEAMRLIRAWNEYVASEHPEAPPSAATFRGADHGGRGAPQHAP